jgi:ferredoxin-type protein NapH
VSTAFDRLPGTPPARWQRLIWQGGFFLLFALAPVFDLLRFDLHQGHAFILGMPWHLGLDDFFAGRITGLEAGLNILLRLFLPLALAVATFMLIAWRWGRLYCGWLCPHFSAVELINGLMRRASGKPSLWEDQTLVACKPDGSPRPQGPGWWLLTVAFALVFAFVWAVVLLTYLLPPAEIYANLWAGDLTPNQARSIGAATIVLSLEFIFARHLFCRYGCAVGLFQSLAWMANRGAMVVGFKRLQAADCARCQAVGGQGYAACEAECPMRLRPRQAKHKMFACTQCAQCLNACNTVQQQAGREPLLRWVEKEAARQQEAQVSLTGRKD